MRGFWSLGASLIDSSSGSLVLLLRPDQRPERDQGALLLGRCSEASVQPLAGEQRGYRAFDRSVSLRGSQGEQRFQRGEQIGVGPGAISFLLGGNQAGESGGDSSSQFAGGGERVDPGHNRVSGEVA